MPGCYEHDKGTEDSVLTCLFLFTAPAAAPQTPSSTTLSATAIQVQWEEVPAIDRNGIVTFYEVRVDPAQFQIVRYENVSGSELVLVVDGLEEFVEYSFTIRAYTIVGPGPFSVITTNTTNQAGKRITSECDKDALTADTCMYWYYRECTNFVFTIFRGLIYRGDKFLWVRIAHQFFMCTNFRGFNFRGCCLPSKISPQRKFLRVRYDHLPCLDFKG